MARPVLVALAVGAGALALAGVVWLVRRPGAAVTPAAVVPSQGKRAKVHNRHRLPAALQAFADWWEGNGPFDLQVPVNGGVRTDAEQRALFAEGRTAPGTIVTDAPTAADSAHGHGGGGDLYPVRTLDSGGRVATIYLGSEAEPGVRAEALARFKVLQAAAEAFGLESGARFPRVDLPHVQVRFWRSLPLAIPPVA